MTGHRLQIRTERHGQASTLTTAALPHPAVGPSVPGDAERPEAALSGMPGNSDPLLPLPDRPNRGT